MKPATAFAVIALTCVAQMLLSTVFLEFLSARPEWNALYGEDSTGYLLVVEFFRAGEEPHKVHDSLTRYRLFSPFVPFVVSLLNRFLSVQYAFLLLNACLWVTASFLVFAWSRTLFDHHDLALCTSLIFCTSLPVIIWGLPMMVDMGAYFFVALALLCVLHPSAPNRPLSLLTGLTLALSVLTKPLLCFLFLFLFVYGLTRRELRRTLWPIAMGSIVAFALYWMLGLTASDFLSFGAPRHRGWVYVISAFAFCYHWGLLLAVWALRWEKRGRAFYASYLLSALAVCLVFVHNPRLLFLTYPGVLPLVVHGMNRFASFLARRQGWREDKTLFGLTCAYILTSNVLACFYLYVTRVIQCRSVEELGRLLQSVF